MDKKITKFTFLVSADIIPKENSQYSPDVAPEAKPIIPNKIITKWKIYISYQNNIVGNTIIIIVVVLIVIVVAVRIVEVAIVKVQKPLLPPLLHHYNTNITPI